MRVLITGGTGFIGRAAVRRLTAGGHECLVVTRDPGRAARIGLPPGTTFLSDIAQSPVVDAVVLLAGESVAGLWTQRKRAAILSSRVEGTRRAVEWMRAASQPPSVLVSASAVGYYGHCPGKVLDESSAPDPAVGFRSRVCIAWEAEARRAEEIGVRTVVPRFGVVLGPDGGMLADLLRLHRLRFSFVLGNQDAVVPWVAINDVAALIEFALGNSSLHGPVNVVAPVRTTQEAFTRAIARAVGSRVLGRLPAWLLRAAVGDLSSAVLDDQHVVPGVLSAIDFGFAETDIGGYLNRAIS
jgi:uncharacterized protein